MISAEQAMKQAITTTDKYLCSGIKTIDDMFGDGYAENNPTLLSAYLHTCVKDFEVTVASGCVSNTINNTLMWKHSK